MATDTAQENWLQFPARRRRENRTMPRPCLVLQSGPSRGTATRKSAWLDVSVRTRCAAGRCQGLAWYRWLRPGQQNTSTMSRRSRRLEDRGESAQYPVEDAAIALAQRRANIQDLYAALTLRGSTLSTRRSSRPNSNIPARAKARAVGVTKVINAILAGSVPSSSVSRRQSIREELRACVKNWLNWKSNPILCKCSHPLTSSRLGRRNVHCSRLPLRNEGPEQNVAGSPHSRDAISESGRLGDSYSADTGAAGSNDCDEILPITGYSELTHYQPATCLDG